MSNTLPANVPKTMPVNVIVDQSGRISQTELGILDGYAARTHYSPHVLILSTKTAQSTQDLALEIARTWNLESNGLFVLVNTSNDTVAVVAGQGLRSKGITAQYIDEHILPKRFQREYGEGNLSGAIRAVFAGVERKLNVVAISGQKAQPHVSHQQTHFGDVQVFFVFFAFFIFLVILALSSSRENAVRRQIWEPYERKDVPEFSDDLERIHQILGTKQPVKQVPMKEFAQRATSGRSTQSGLEPLPLPTRGDGHESSRMGEYIEQVIAQELDKKIHAAEKKAGMKLIFEGAHADAKKPEAVEPPGASHPIVYDEPIVAQPPLESHAPSEMPGYSPYEFPQDEVSVPTVASLEPQPTDPVVAGLPIDSVSQETQANVSAPNVAEVAQTTDSILKVDQYAQAMKEQSDQADQSNSLDAPGQAADSSTWRPATYTMPPKPVMPVAPTLPGSQFATNAASDFGHILGQNESTYASYLQAPLGSVGSPSATSSLSANQTASPGAGVCPQCQSEKSPDFSFCLHCGHMFV